MSNITAWILLGLIAGAIAMFLDPQARGGGIIPTIALGIRRETYLIFFQRQILI